MFSNALYLQSKGANRAFVKEEVLGYAAQQRHVLRVAASRHFLSADPLQHQPSEYKIKDDLTYQVQVQEWEASSSSWKPYRCQDLQVEFVMLDPYVRMALSPLEQQPFQGWY